MHCQTCKTIGVLFGKKIFMPLLGHRYPLLRLEHIRSLVADLDLSIGGGLSNRGWTFNDIDVNGRREDVYVLAARLKECNIPHPIHYCGPHNTHSHAYCAYNGIKLALTGKGY